MALVRESNIDRINRAPMEFSDETKIEALKRASFKCEDCGRSKEDLKKAGEPGYFQLHHILGIAVAVRLFPWIGYEVIKSVENCRCLCHKCHRVEENSRPDHEEIATELLNRYEQRQLKVERQKALLGSGGRRRV